jgi:hypothetical protein
VIGRFAGLLFMTAFVAMFIGIGAMVVGMAVTAVVVIWTDWHASPEMITMYDPIAGVTCLVILVALIVVLRWQWEEGQHAKKVERARRMEAWRAALKEEGVSEATYEKLTRIHP